MKQKKLNIPALLLLFTFLLGTIGMNVSKVYCQRCQETYLHVMVIPQDIPCPCTHGCYCCHHMCHNAHKKNCDNAKQEHTYYKVSGDWAMSHFEIHVEMRLQNALNTLPDKCREIILLKIVEGKKNKEIANQLGLAETTVKTQVQRAYRILREQLIPILLFISWLQNGGY